MASHRKRTSALLLAAAAGSSFCTFNAGGVPTVVVQVGNEAASQGQPQAVTSVQVSG